jgi:hypothetical protein
MRIESGCGAMPNALYDGPNEAADVVAIRGDRGPA